MQRISRNELTALLTMLGITAGTMANAAPTSTEKPFLVAEKQGAKKPAEMACGKGSCGVDVKGAAAAKEKSAKKAEEKKTVAKKKSASTK
jgi:uncharacterized low-complexity protein